MHVSFALSGGSTEWKDRLIPAPDYNKRLKAGNFASAPASVNPPRPFLSLRPVFPNPLDEPSMARFLVQSQPVLLQQQFGKVIQPQHIMKHLKKGRKEHNQVNKPSIV